MKKKRKNCILLLLILLFLAAFLYSGYRVVTYVLDSNSAAEETESLIEAAVTLRPAELPQPSVGKTEEVKPPEEKPAESSSSSGAVEEPVPAEPVQTGEKAPIVVDFAALWKKSDDVVAWLYSPDTPINYHVAQAEDNVYYLDHMINGKTNRGGTLFVDYRNDPAMTDRKTLIYGHAMSIGTMFGTLERYKRQAYYEAHPVMYLLTPEMDYALDLVAGYMTDVSDPVFNIPATDEEADAQLAHVLKKSAFRTKAEIPEDARMVTLSTCAYDFENARFVVVGVLRELER